jgi:hypothetical protein
VIINYTIDLLFFLDIIVNFFSAYIDETFQVIDDRKTIACNYFKGWFSIDLIAIIPFDVFLEVLVENGG